MNTEQFNYSHIIYIPLCLKHSSVFLPKKDKGRTGERNHFFYTFVYLFNKQLKGRGLKRKRYSLKWIKNILILTYLLILNKMNEIKIFLLYKVLHCQDKNFKVIQSISNKFFARCFIFLIAFCKQPI